MESNTPSVHQFELDDYEIVNLVSALIFLKDVGGDTGDWYAQVLTKLNQVDLAEGVHPNKASQVLRRDLALRVGWAAIFGGER